MRDIVARIIGAVFSALVLASCGGGGDAGSSPPTASEARGKERAPDPTLMPSPVSLVNTTTEAAQVLRAIGATSDGGYTVAWLSGGSTLYMQHYDSAGAKESGETLIDLVIPNSSPEQTGQAIASSSVAVLTDGSVVVAYLSWEPAPAPYSEQLVSGIYIQRFDASGARISPEARLVAQSAPDTPCGSRCSRSVAEPRVDALTDGAFVVSWTVSTNIFGYPTSAHVQRFSAEGQGGGAGSLGCAGLEASLSSRIMLHPEPRGGFVFSIHCTNARVPGVVVSSTRYDAAMRSQGPAPGVPLEVGYVHFSSGASGATLQMLDSAGNPLGEAIAIPAVPSEAWALSDGGFLALWRDGTVFTAQRFSPTGAAVGQRFTVRPGAAAFEVAVLTEPGFALAWTAPGANGDDDVYTQRFVENPAARKKVCLDAAKERKLKGKERKAFIDFCITHSGQP